MRSILLSVASVLFINWFWSSCANPSTINGGPRDTIPPVLLEAIPPNGQVNFSGKTLRLSFSEEINIDKLNQELIITPFLENEFKSIAKKNSLTIEFEDEFPDSTTFILNFAEGVGDLNENNAVVNLKYAFSTGTFIDSLTLTGYVFDLMSNEPAGDYLISMYDQDTSSVFENKPTYFAYADEEGLFTIENIKSGYYHIYAIDDENKNLLLEPKEEKHGLLTDTLLIDSTSTFIEIPVILQDASELNLVRSRAQANRFDIRYSKYIYDFDLQPLDTSSTIHERSFIEEQTAIRLYPNSIEELDSTGYIVTVYDSLGTSVSDTVYVLFEGNAGRLDELELSVTSNSNKTLDSTLFTVRSSKPIKILDPTNFELRIDTITLDYQIDTSIVFKTNPIKSEVQFALPNYYSTISTYIDSVSRLLNADTLRIREDSIYADTVKYFDKIKSDQYTIRFNQGWLYSIEKDTAEFFEQNITQPTATDVGLVRGNIYTVYQSYFVELIDKNGKIVKSLSSPKETYELLDVAPGSYTIRVKIDTNEDGQWSYGNIRNHTAPEPIFFMEESFEVRANWELEGIDLSF